MAVSTSVLCCSRILGCEVRGHLVPNRPIRRSRHPGRRRRTFHHSHAHERVSAGLGCSYMDLRAGLERERPYGRRRSDYPLSRPFRNFFFDLKIEGLRRPPDFRAL